jgi:hypothetical protein
MGKRVELTEQSVAVFNVVTNDQKTYKEMVYQLKRYKNGGGGWKELKARLKHSINSYLKRYEYGLVLDDSVKNQKNPRCYKAYNCCENQLDHLCNFLLHYYSQEVFGYHFDDWCDKDNPPPTSKEAYQNNAAAYADEIKTKEKQPMSKKTIKIENKTYVNGVGVAGMTDDELFNQIAETEKEIARLEAIKTQPKKLKTRIADLQAGIEGLVKIVDGRD